MKIRQEKVRNAIKKSKIEGVRKRALEKIKAKTASKKEPEFIPGPTVRPDCPSCGHERNGVENHYCPTIKCAGCTEKVYNHGDFCESCRKEPAEDHK